MTFQRLPLGVFLRGSREYTISQLKISVELLHHKELYSICFNINSYLFDYRLRRVLMSYGGHNLFQNPNALPISYSKVKRRNSKSKYFHKSKLFAILSIYASDLSRFYYRVGW